jgi:hypothetical protein
MTTLELVNYYANLLILQYKSKPKAYSTMLAWASQAVMPQVSTQQISFSAVAASGQFILSYDGMNTAAINWNDSTPTIESTLQAITGLGSVTVTGSIATQILTITFTGVIPPAFLLILESSTLQDGGSNDITISIAETDVTLPIAVQDAFNLLGPSPAVGVQLDILGKYAGVTRTGNGFNGQPITLSDADFLTFIKMAITTNSAGSSLSDISNILYQYFGMGILAFDYTDMRLDYLINSSIGSIQLLELFVTEKLLPKPMAVGISVIVAPVIDSFFGFVTYEDPVQSPITRPFNDYDNYQTNWPWLSYVYSFTP